MIKELKHFIQHLRLHYQLFILSGGFLLGGLLADQMNTAQFWMQFLNVHVLLFGGATAYNSFWDKDEGPIGGLKKPPKMTLWMHRVSLIFMYAGLLWSLSMGAMYVLVFGLSLLLFWLYSTPHVRWKGHPELSLVAIAVSTGSNSVILGVLAAGGAISINILLGSTGAAMILLSIYPISQIYQGDEDNRRGDKTFFIKYGLTSVKIFYAVLFLSGLILLSFSLYQLYEIPAILLLLLGLTTYLILLIFILRLTGNRYEYRNVMGIKFFASLSFVLFLIASNAIRYEWIGETFLKGYF